MPPIKGSSWEDSKVKGGKMARTVKDRDDEEPERKYLGRCQSLVKKGVGLMGRENGVVLIAVRNFRGAGVSRGPAVMSHVTEHFAGVSLHHVHGCSAYVATADHCVASLVRRYREQRWQLQVYVMPAAQFQGLDTKSKWDINRLIQKGAKKAIGFYSLVLDHGLRSSDPSHCTYGGIDIAIVKLVWTLPGLSSMQPHVLTEREVANVRAYFRTHPGAKVMIHLEGSGQDVCEEWDHGGEDELQQRRWVVSYKTPQMAYVFVTTLQWNCVSLVSGRLAARCLSIQQRRCDHDHCTRCASQVKWREISDGKWTRTKGFGMRGAEFGEILSQASHTNFETSQMLLTDAGQLDIDEVYVPPGFSGGGVYTSLPAKALCPAASANAPDVKVLLGTCSTCFYDDDEDSKPGKHVTTAATLTAGSPNI